MDPIAPMLLAPIAKGRAWGGEWGGEARVA